MQTHLRLDLNFEQERIYAEALRLLIAKLEHEPGNVCTADKIETAKRMLEEQESGMYIDDEGRIRNRVR